MKNDIKKFEEYYSANFKRTSSLLSGLTIMIFDAAVLLLCIGIGFFLVNLANKSFIRFRSFIDYYIYIPAILAVTPTLYDFFGRREFVIGAGTGHYFNGVGKIGVRREFSFDETTGVRKGESAYYYADHSVGHKDVTGTRAMTRIPEVQLFPVGCATPARLCASDDEALIDAFVRLLPVGCATPARLCASDDEALIDAFVRLLREAIQHRDMYGT